MRELPPIQVTVSGSRTSLRLKSSLPGQGRAEQAVELGGVRFPTVVGTTVRAAVAPIGGTTATGEFRALCLAPDEWLVVWGTRSAAQDLARIRSQVHEQGVAAVDLSDALTVLRVEGSEAQELLSKGCGLDLDRRSFPTGRCARTRFAQIAVTLERVGERAFELYAGRSYSAYLQAWLTDAAAEFQ